MKRKQRSKGGITPSFASLRDQLIPPTVGGEAPPATKYSDGLPGSEAWRDLVGKNPLRSKGSVGGLHRFYDSFLNSKTWREIISPPIRERARGHCENCARKASRLEVHHKTYIRFGGRERPEDLQALCDLCHRGADIARREAMRAMKSEWESAFYLKRYEGYMNYKYDEEWRLMHYAYSRESFDDFDAETLEWEERRLERGDE
jgi:hypothetical protein